MDYLTLRYLSHSGVKGQKWGIRRYQNADGSLTPEGRIHYGVGNLDYNARYSGDKKSAVKAFKKERKKLMSNIKDVYKNDKKNKNEEYVSRDGYKNAKKQVNKYLTGKYGKETINDAIQEKIFYGTAITLGVIGTALAAKGVSEAIIDENKRTNEMRNHTKEYIDDVDHFADELELHERQKSAGEFTFGDKEGRLDRAMKRANEEKEMFDKHAKGIFKRKADKDINDRFEEVNERYNRVKESFKNNPTSDSPVYDDVGRSMKDVFNDKYDYGETVNPYKKGDTFEDIKKRAKDA